MKIEKVDIGGSSAERLVELPPFSFWETRAGSGTPVVLIHGLSGSRAWWRKNLDALASRHLVVAIDLVGFGATRKVARHGPLPLSFDDVAALLARWLGEEFDQPVHLVGHSMGGHIAIHLAASYPRLIRSLVLVNSTGLPFRIDPRAHLRNIYPVPRGVISFSRVLAADFLRAGPFSVTLGAVRLLSDDAREALKTIAVPTLIVWGERDPLVPSAYGEELSRALKNAQLTVLPEAGHVSMWDNAEAFNERVLEFVANVEGDATRVLPESEYVNWGLAGTVAGMTYRRIGASPTPVVLVHGLGVSTTYFKPLARALRRRGLEVAAPDLPGFGYSIELPVNAAGDADAVISWARALGFERTLFVGQSTGCQVVEQIAAKAPDLVERCVYVSPIWTGRPHAAIRLASKLAVDALMEKPRLVAIAVASYWRAGFARFLKAWRFYLRDVGRERRLRHHDVIVIGADDPLVDRDHLRECGAGRIIELSGAHAVHWSNAEGVAQVIAGLR